MKDFIETIKSLPDIVKKTIRVYKNSWKNSGVYFLGYIIFSLVVAFSPYLRNWAQGEILNSFQLNIGHISQIYFSVAIFIVAIILPSIVSIFSQFASKMSYYKDGEFYENKVIEKSLSINPQLHEDKYFTNLLNKVNEKGIYVLNNFKLDSFSIILDFLVIIVVSVTLFHFSRMALLVIFITSIPTLLVNIKYGQGHWFIWGNDVDTEKRKKFWRFRYYIDSFSSYIELYLTKSGKYFSLFRSNFLKETFVKQKQNELNLKNLGFLAGLINWAGIIYVIIYFINQVIDKSILVGTFVFVVSLVTGYTLTLTSFFRHLSLIYPDYKYIDNFFEFLDFKNSIENTGTKKFENKAPIIEFKNVYFKYPDSTKYVLEDFSLKIESGDKLAVIGLNGAGKTTFVKLLCRFYDVTEGEILFNGVNIKEYDLESWYEILGVLFQEYGKYEIPINELVMLGRYDGDMDDKLAEKNVKHALKLAEAEFVKSFPEKEKTQLGKEFTGGVDVSVGQWQKLAIARMFYRDPAVMVLDEPTSSIDAEAEMKIFETLETFSKSKTVIMISHRFSTVRNADKICVINEGRVYEHGTHEELIALNGEYARLFNLQAEGYK
jgi:ATP-binding cassette subfamily B protein/ATP-binding cassette subfamily C protein